jgi:hypothetical protein
MNDKSTIQRAVRNRENPYAQIRKAALRDERLSWKARGILGYILTNSDEWKIYVSELANHSDKDGRDSTANGVKELIEHGYISRTRKHDENGRFCGCDYQVTEYGNTVNGLSVNGLAEYGKSVANNKELKKIKNSKDPLTPKGELSAQFDEFRKRYPGTKRGLGPETETLKKAAKKSNTPLADLIDKIKEAVENQKNWRAQLKRQNKFVPEWPHLSTWLNQQRWTEEPPQGVVVAAISGAIDSNPDSILPAAQWKDWPQIKGWSKSANPGYYVCPINGTMYWKDMPTRRMARMSMFPAALLPNAQVAA